MREYGRRLFHLVIAAGLCAALAGCTHRQLARSTVLTTSTVMEIQYRVVLTNLAMMSCHPEGFPSHADLSEGVVQVNDQYGFGQTGGITTFTGEYGFGLDQFGPVFLRQLTAQWGTDAITDPVKLNDLQDVYRLALGLQPLPLPHSVAYLRSRPRQRQRNDNDNGDRQGTPAGRRPQAEEQLRVSDDRGDDSNGGANGNGNGGGNGNGNGNGGNARVPWAPRDQISRQGPFHWASNPTSPGGEGSVPSEPDNGNGNGGKDVPIEVLLADVPRPGWFHIGSKSDVPSNACFVGRYNDRYAWVNAEGMPALARFTLIVLFIVKPDPGEGRANGGLAVTG